MSDKKPKVDSFGQRELDKAEKKFEEFNESCKELTQDKMASAPKEEREPQTKLSEREKQALDGVWLKPEKVISCGDQKFNEKFRQSYEFDKEYVAFIAEHHEIIGDTIEIWTRPYGGLPAEMWKVPTNKKCYGPRYLAEQIKKCRYTRLSTEDNVTGSDHMGKYFGTLVAEKQIQRLDATPVSDRKSIFMGVGA